MYKKTQVNADFHERVGSFSTHGTARGVVHIFPKETLVEDLATRASLREQQATLRENVRVVDAQIVEANKRYRDNGLKDLIHQKQCLETALGDIRKLLYEAHCSTFTAVFYQMSYRFLTQEALNFLLTETKKVMIEAEEESKKLASR